MLQPIEQYYLEKEEPVQGLLLALREIILRQDENLGEAWKYGMPFFCYKGKMCCYLWTHKKYGQPYIGFVEGGRMHHPLLLQEKRARMKILLFNPAEDIPVELLSELLGEMLNLYRK